MASASTTKAANIPLLRRIISRHGRSLLRKRRGEPGGRADFPPSKAPPTPKDEASWPLSLRYAFYAGCVVSIPLSVCQLIAMSPRLRERLSDDDGATTEEEGARGLTSSARMISFVREYWGVNEYVPPVDAPRVTHVDPGRRYEWQSDNRSSLLHLLGMYAPKNTEEEEMKKNAIPVSLENEPPSNVRSDQRNLMRYLSSATNPSGVKTRLTLLPYGGGGGQEGEEAAYETECTLPADVPLSALRSRTKGSMAQAFKRDLAELHDPDFQSRSTQETLRTRSWNEECRWTASFSASDDDDDVKGEEEYNLNSNRFGVGSPPLSNDIPASNAGEETTTTWNASREMRHASAVHSTWSYFPELATGSSSSSNSPLGNNNNNGIIAGPSSSSNNNIDTSVEGLKASELKHRIETLERELNDPSSMRDRDVMYEELRGARREERSMRPWYRRWG